MNYFLSGNFTLTNTAYDNHRNRSPSGSLGHRNDRSARRREEPEREAHLGHQRVEQIRPQLSRVVEKWTAAPILTGSGAISRTTRPTGSGRTIPQPPVQPRPLQVDLLHAEFRLPGRNYNGSHQRHGPEPLLDEGQHRRAMSPPSSLPRSIRRRGFMTARARRRSGTTTRPTPTRLKETSPRRSIPPT